MKSKKDKIISWNGNELIVEKNGKRFALVNPEFVDINIPQKGKSNDGTITYQVCFKERIKKNVD